MPCSGLNSATSVTFFAACSRSIVEVPSRARPVWLVTQADLGAGEPREPLGAQHVDAGQHRRAAVAALAGAR